MAQGPDCLEDCRERILERLQKAKRWFVVIEEPGVLPYVARHQMTAGEALDETLRYAVRQELEALEERPVSIKPDSKDDVT